MPTPLLCQYSWNCCNKRSQIFLLFAQLSTIWCKLWLFVSWCESANCVNAFFQRGLIICQKKHVVPHDLFNHKRTKKPNDWKSTRGTTTETGRQCEPFQFLLCISMCSCCHNTSLMSASISLILASVHGYRWKTTCVDPSAVKSYPLKCWWRWSPGKEKLLKLPLPTVWVWVARLFNITLPPFGPFYKTPLRPATHNKSQCPTQKV